MQTRVMHTNIVKVEASASRNMDDLLAVEEPLEIRLHLGPESERRELSLSVTMRTPGHDEELVLGFLISEGLVRGAEDVLSVRHCERVEKPEEQGNVIRARLHPDVDIDPKKLDRHFYTSSSCGVCGKTSIEAVHQHCPLLPPANNPRLSASLIHQLPDRLREAQAVFEYTGGLHAAGLFDASGKLLLMREDVGRHNALDKLIGAAAFAGLLPLQDKLVQVSGRASFELVQKTLMAGAPVLSAVGAPSSLAVALARDSGMTLLGFVRNQRFNVYCGMRRFVED